jgi:hypothetical protein
VAAAESDEDEVEIVCEVQPTAAAGAVIVAAGRANGAFREGSIFHSRRIFTSVCFRMDMLIKSSQLDDYF